jgi:hypothetical protein
MAKQHQGKPLRRQAAFRTPKRTFLVFCEGERTESDYLKALKREPAVREVASVDIQIDKDSYGSAPLTLVKAAVEARERAGGELDEVWCIFDVEQPQNHPNLREAVSLAGENDVRVAVSNPCFEFWLALHFGEHSRPLKTTEAIRLRQAYDKRNDKGLDGSQYMPLRNDAARRAKALGVRHEGNGTEFPNNNPSSGMHRFLESVEGHGGDAG